MEYLGIGAIAIIGLTVMLTLFWFDYRRSTCGYGGSQNGKDNWAFRIIREQIRSVKRFAKWLNRPKYQANEYSDFKDVFSL